MLLLLDRSAGANPWKVVEALRTKLKMHAAALQIPMGAEDNFKGVIDLLKWKALSFEGIDGYVSTSICMRTYMDETTF